MFYSLAMDEKNKIKITIIRSRLGS